MQGVILMHPIYYRINNTLLKLFRRIQIPCSDCFVNQPENFVQLPGGEGNILHPSFFLERNHDPGIFKEIERCTVPAVHEHEVYPCPAVFFDQRWIVQLAGFDVVHWHGPVEDAKGQPQSIRRQPDGEFSVIQRVEKEGAEEEKKNDRKEIQTSRIHAPEQ